MSNWGFEKFGDKIDKWPKDETGKPEKPVFLEHITGNQLDIEMEINVLDAYDIPAVTAYPNDGEFGKLILGFAGTGVDIFVPESLLQDAMNILSSRLEPDEIDG